MNEKQALDIIGQAVNVGVGAGAFKNSKDVAIVSQALEVLIRFISPELEQGPSAELVEEPTKKSK